MDDQGCSFVVAVFMLFVIGLVIGCSMGGCGRNRERERAFEAGVGRYVVDPESGETTFVYGCPAIKGE